MKTSGNTILITGGGSGIGGALAKRFHDLGNTIIIAGRRPDALAQVAQGRANIHPMPFDVSDAGAIDAFAQAVVAAHPALNVVVNNAGMMQIEDIGTTRDLAGAEATIITNLLGPIRLTNALVDHLATQPNAALVNVTSGLAFVPLVFAATYSATKAALHSYTVSLREVLRGRIEVIELAPPGVQTELTPGQATREGYMPLDDYIDEVMALFAAQPTPPEILVEAVKPLRQAEAKGEFPTVLGFITARARSAGQG